MPEIATLAGARAPRHDVERLDVRHLVPRHQPDSHIRSTNGSAAGTPRAGIIINTGEDNYLTTADGVEAAHTVDSSASCLNEYFGKEAGLVDDQLGLGHAFEINPSVPGVVSYGARPRRCSRASCSRTRR